VQGTQCIRTHCVIDSFNTSGRLPIEECDGQRLYIHKNMLGSDIRRSDTGFMEGSERTADVGG
jgi:hypothetical protein